MMRLKQLNGALQGSVRIAKKMLELVRRIAPKSNPEGADAQNSYL